MVEIQKEKCVGCGLCTRDCIAGNLVLKDGTAFVEGDCFLCGHCVAICPQRAVSIPAYDMADVEDCPSESVAMDPARLLRAIKFRRSIRDYKPQIVEREKLALILQAGRYTATAKNTQGCRFIVVQDELETFKDMVWAGIGAALADPKHAPEVELYRDFYETHKANPQTDYLFRNAPAVLFIAAETNIDAGLAAQNMELEAVSLGLGMLYNGYLRRAAAMNPRVCDWLDTGNRPLEACALLGYPAVTYARTAPRRMGDYILR